MTPKELEKLHNEYLSNLRREFNQFQADVKQRLDRIEDIVAEQVRMEMNLHLPVIHDSIQRIGVKLEKHFGK